MSSPKRVFFEEVQYLTQWWLYLIVIIAPSAMLFGIVSSFLEGEAQGDPFGFAMLFFFFLVVTGLIVFLLLYFRLITQVRTNGIHIRYIPFHWTPKVFLWDEIESEETRTYRPILEYGGWGIRWGLFGKGMAYTVKGNRGLQLVMKDGKRILVGTQKPDELSKAIQNAKEKNK